MFCYMISFCHSIHYCSLLDNFSIPMFLSLMFKLMEYTIIISWWVLWYKLVICWNIILEVYFDKQNILPMKLRFHHSIVTSPWLAVFHDFFCRQFSIFGVFYDIWNLLLVIHIWWQVHHNSLWPAGPQFNIKMSYQYRKYYCGDKSHKIVLSPQWEFLCW